VYQHHLTETQQKALERHRSFRKSIAARAVPDSPIVCRRSSQGLLKAIVFPPRAPEQRVVATPLPLPAPPPPKAVLPKKKKQEKKPKRETLGQRILRANGDLSLVRIEPVQRRRQRPVDEPVALPVFAVTPTGQQRIPAERIKCIVAGYFRIAVADLEAYNQLPCFAYPRHMAIYLVCKFSGIRRRPVIGQLFSRNRDAVWYALKRVEKLVEGADPEVVSDIHELSCLIQSEPE
jgi:Bacterial dnaA protein helix-turn-helix